MKRTAKLLLVIVATPTIIGAILFGVVFLVNARDEPLLPQVRTALNEQHADVPSNENLFFPILAFDVLSSADLRRSGQQIYANHLATPHSASAALSAAPTSAHYKFFGDTSKLCAMRAPDCLEQIAAGPEYPAHLITQNALLLERYSFLMRFDRFEDELHPTLNSPLIDWRPVLLAKRLLLTSIAVDFAQGRVAVAVALLRDETLFTRKMLAERDVLMLDKLVLAASLRDDFILAADTLRRESLNDSELAQMREIAAPLTIEERSLRGPFEREFETSAAVYQELADPKSGPQFLSVAGATGFWPAIQGRLAQHFFKVNATLNSAWVADERRGLHSEASCRDFETLRAEHDSAASVPLRLSRYSYNPIGKVLVQIADDAPSQFQWIGVFCDLQAMQRIVMLQTLIRSQQVGVQEVGSFIANAPHQLADPYTEKPFRWDSLTRTVTFEVGTDRDEPLVPWRLEP